MFSLVDNVWKHLGYGWVKNVFVSVYSLSLFRLVVCELGKVRGLSEFVHLHSTLFIHIVNDVHVSVIDSFSSLYTVPITTNTEGFKK